ncbi:unnamed protein product [Fraxinus pennsylvanica]|uniref:NAC domain-containing protein n=1 Tax=Fraxinus pennsylvanica TaxID=56036 RepID=A0AAD2AGH6_9LAMI|nr:unnamed protein product [Fraxinus pennsylvanica]
MNAGESDPISKLSLPPGFRFYPTDEELLVQYLCRKIAGHQFALQIIADIDLYKFDAWELPSKAMFGEKECKNGGSRLDDWVLCRIYKKNSSNGQSRSFSDAQSKEYSHGSTSSSSHQYDDVMGYLPEIDNRFFSLPRMNSLKTFHQEDQKLNLQNTGSGNFDWHALAGLNSVPELGQVQKGQTQGIMNSQKIMNGQNEVYAPATQQQLGSVVDDEVQSGLRNGFSQSSTFTNSLDPFWIRFSTQPGGFGFKQ